MADINISELPPITTATDDDVFIINDGDLNTSKITWTNLRGTITEFAVPISFAVGSENSPSITFTNDLNLGIYSPATDELGFVTNGAERIRIDASGKVGLGTKTPGANLEVSGSGIPTIRITDEDGTDSFGQVSFDNSNLLIESRNGTDYGNIVFRGRDDVGSSEFARLTDIGWMGIGTANPQSTLHISSGASGVSGTVPGIFGPIVEAFATQNAGMVFQTESNRTAGFYFSDPQNAQAGSVVFNHSDDRLDFNVNEIARLSMATDTQFFDSAGTQTAVFTDDGRLRIGTGTPTTGAISVTSNIGGSAVQSAIELDVTVQSDVTTSYTTYSGSFDTEATSFTLPTAYLFRAEGGTLGAGSNITNQYGFYAANLGNATNNYGFYSDISTVGDYQYYSAGTSPNYFRGSSTTFVNGATTALTISGGQIATPQGTVTNLTSTTADITTANITQANAADIDFTSTLEGPSATITTIGATSVSADLFTGDLTGDVTGDLFGNADTSSQILSTPSNTNAYYKLTFVQTPATGGTNRNLFTDSVGTDLTYNPSTNILNVYRADGTILNYTTANITTINGTDVTLTNELQSPIVTGTTVNATTQLNAADIDFTGSVEGPLSTITTMNATTVNATMVNSDVTGNLTGNADTTTKAYVTDNSSSTATHRVVFASGANANQNLRSTQNFTYVPSTNTLTAQNIDAAFNLTAPDATITDLVVTGTLTMPPGSSISDTIVADTIVAEDITINDDLVVTDLATFGGVTTFNAAVNFNSTVTASSFTGNLAGNATSASTVSTSINSSNSSQYLGFVTNSSGNQEIKTDGTLRYNPSTKVLSGKSLEFNDRVIVGAHSGGVALTINDGGGNANLTFNHNSLIPDQDGQAARISVNVDATAGSVSTIDFLTADDVTAGVSAPATPRLKVSSDGIVASGVDFLGDLIGDVTGDLFGNADTATNAANADRSDTVTVTATGTSADYNVVFTNTSDTTSPNGNIYKDAGGGFHYNPSNNTLSVTNFNGTATNATNVKVIDDAATGTEYYPTFVSGGAGNSKSLRVDTTTGISYNGNGTLTAPVFSGNLTGNADTATNATSADEADTIKTIGRNSSTNTHFLPFVSTSGTQSNQSVYTDSDLQYVPSTNTLTVGFVDGLADVADQVVVDNFTGATGYQLALTLGSGTQDIGTSSQATFNPTNGNLVAPTFVGNLTGNADTATLATDASNADRSDTVTVTASSSAANYNVVFTNVEDTTNTTGNIYKDAGGGFHYNPNNNTLSVTNLSGTATNATNVLVDSDTSTNANRYLVFTNSGGSTNQRMKIDGQLFFNPSTDTLVSPKIDVSQGDISTFTASTIDTTGDITISGSGSKTLRVETTDGGSSDSILVLRGARTNADTNPAIISFESNDSTISGLGYDGKLAQITGGKVRESGGGILRFNVQDADGTAPTERMTLDGDGDLQVDGTVSAGGFSGNLTGNVTGNLTGTASNATNATNATNADRADNVTVTATGTSANYNVVFTDTTDTTSTTGSLYKDSGGGFHYNPSTNTVAAGNFSGNGSSLTSLNGSNISSGTVSAARLPDATTGAQGVVQLIDSFTSTSNTRAVTAAALRDVYLMTIPSGSKMLFYNSSAPTGWTKATSLTDYAIRVISGTGGGTGGNVGFTTAFASKTVPVPYHKHNANASNQQGGHTHNYSGTTSNAGAHTHTYTKAKGGWSGAAGNVGDTWRYSENKSTGSAGSHNHNFSGTTSGVSGNHNHNISLANAGTSGAAINLTVKYMNVILCTKN